MKVIKKGRKQTGWAKEYKCTASGNGNQGCGATLFVEESDIKFTGEKQCIGDNYPDYFYGFLCPECGNVTDVKDVPSRITSKIKKVISEELKGKIY